MRLRTSVLRRRVTLSSSQWVPQLGPDPDSRRPASYVRRRSRFTLRLPVAARARPPDAAVTSAMTSAAEKGFGGLVLTSLVDVGGTVITGPTGSAGSYG